MSQRPGIRYLPAAFTTIEAFLPTSRKVESMAEMRSLSIRTVRPERIVPDPSSMLASSIRTEFCGLSDAAMPAKGSRHPLKAARRDKPEDMAKVYVRIAHLFQDWFDLLEPALREPQLNDVSASTSVS